MISFFCNCIFDLEKQDFIRDINNIWLKYTYGLPRVKNDFFVIAGKYKCISESAIAEAVS